MTSNSPHEIKHTATFARQCRQTSSKNTSPPPHVFLFLAGGAFEPAGGLPAPLFFVLRSLPPFSNLIASLYLARYTFRGSTYLSNPSVDIAHNKSSPLIVLRFSCIHLSEASDVTKDINSEVDSCTHSFESFALDFRLSH